MTSTGHDRTGHDKWLIYCPAINPDTLLHLSIQGDSYALRDFTGRLTAVAHRSGHARAFKARDENGRELTTTAEFKRAFDFDWKVDVYDQGVAVSKADRWREIVGRHNLRLGIGN